MRLIPLVLLVLSISAHGKTQFVGVKSLPNSLKVHEYKLDNGMQLLFVPDSSAPVFSFGVWFKVGSADEKLDPRLQKTGLAHLFEHMMFRGTPRFGDQQFDTVLTSAGAVGNNATTWLDRTNYFQSLPKERLELIFDLEADRMGNLILEEKLFKTELGAVLGELKMNKDKPSRAANDYLWNTAFEVHPYRYTTIGTEEELNSFTVEDGRYFYKTFYAPNNATLIVVGDINVKKAVKLAEKYYGPYKSQVIPRPEAPIEPEQTKARYREEKHPLATNELLYIGYKSPDVNHPDMAALEVTAALLSIGDGSLLERALVQSGLVASTTVSNYNLRWPSLFVISNQIVNGKSARSIRDKVEEAILSIQEGKVTERELERAKNQLLLSAYGGMTDSDSLGDFLGESLVSAGDYMRGFQVLQEVKAVTVSDVVRVAKSYLKPERSTQILLKPGK